MEVQATRVRVGHEDPKKKDARNLNENDGTPVQESKEKDDFGLRRYQK